MDLNRSRLERWEQLLSPANLSEPAHSEGIEFVASLGGDTEMCRQWGAACIFLLVRIGLHLAILAWRRPFVRALCWGLSSHLCLRCREGTLWAVQRQHPRRSAVCWQLCAVPAVAAPSPRPSLPPGFPAAVTGAEPLCPRSCRTPRDEHWLEGADACEHQWKELAFALETS